MKDFFPGKKVGIVAHDAGGAEILSSLVKQEELDGIFSIAGPAQSIFKKKLSKYQNQSLDEVVEQSNFIVCGTGWQTDYEWLGIKKAKKANKKVAAFLDHWGNYPARFQRQNEQVVPDFIYVGDRYAEIIAKNNFPEIQIKYIENPYHREVANRNKSSALVSLDSKSIKILYLCEPITDVVKFGYDEKGALEYFFKNLDFLNLHNPVITIRHHPSESRQKYSWVKELRLASVYLSEFEDVVDDIMNNDIIVGRNSAGLVLSLILEKPSVVCIPPGGMQCILPHKELICFADIIESQGTYLSEVLKIKKQIKHLNKK